MTAQQLKNSILQMAIEGKLVEQNPTDEPASKLLECISDEKEVLIRSGKIKKTTPLPQIEENEIPFELPEGWIWCRLGDIILSAKDGPHYSPSYVKSGIPFISARNIRPEGIDFNTAKYITPELNAELSKRCKPEKGDILYTKGGVTGVATVNDFDIDFNVWVHVAVLKMPSKLNAMYLRNALNSPHCYMLSQRYTHGIGNRDLGLTRMVKITIPLPPLAEQKRIVAKLEELLPHIAEYDAAEKHLTVLNGGFPAMLKKSILQAAVQGKLTEQDYSEPPVGVAPYEGEVPYDVPENWVWCKLSDIGQIIGGGTPKTSENSYWDKGTISWLTPADMKNVKGKYVSHGARNITEKGLSGSSARLMPAQTLVYSSRAPIGYIAIASNPLCTNQGFKSVVPKEPEMAEYLYYCLEHWTPEIQSRASGTTFKEISGSEFGKTVIPLPPLAEQKRIVAKVEGLLNLLDVTTSH